jgi:hypothetical protein
MTLKEKFEQYAKEEIWRTRNYNAEECELIADEFAIGFAEWIRVCKMKGRPYDFENTQELLVIYKEEKDL